MKVKAIKAGFTLGKYRRIGDVFEIPPECFTKTWMIDVSEPEKKEIEEKTELEDEIPEFVGELPKKRGRKKKESTEI